MSIKFIIQKKITSLNQRIYTRYIYCLNDNDVIVYDDWTNRIVYRELTKDLTKSKKYIESVFKKKNLRLVERNVLEKFLDIPLFNSYKSDNSQNEIEDKNKVVPEINIINKKDIIKKVYFYIDKYKLKLPNGEPIKPSFINEGNILNVLIERNKIICYLNSVSGVYVHEFDGKVIKRTNNLETIFQ